MLRVPCYNGCSGRGECTLGVCKCHKGFFGIDCSLYVDKEGKTRQVNGWRVRVGWTVAVCLRVRVSVCEIVIVSSLAEAACSPWTRTESPGKSTVWGRE